MFDQPFARAGRLLGVAAIATALCATAAQAQPAREADYALPAQELASSLREIALRSGVSVIAPGELVSGKQAPPLNGRYAPRRAIDLLLQGSGLRASLVGDALVISRADAGPAERDDTAGPHAGVVRQADRPGLADRGVRLGPPLGRGPAATARGGRRTDPVPLPRGLRAPDG